MRTAEIQEEITNNPNVVFRKDGHSYVNGLFTIEGFTKSRRGAPAVIARPVYITISEEGQETVMVSRGTNEIALRQVGCVYADNVTEATARVKRTFAERRLADRQRTELSERLETLIPMLRDALRELGVEALVQNYGGRADIQMNVTQVENLLEAFGKEIR